MDPITLYVPDNKGKALGLYEELLTGLKAVGVRGRIETAAKLHPGWAVFYGVSDATYPLWKRALAEDRGIYIDNGFFDSTYEGGDHFRITVNGMMADGSAGSGDPARDAAKRDALNIAVMPWRDPKPNDKIVVALQTAPFYDRFCPWGTRDEWLARVRAELAKVTDRRIVVRDKPSKGKPQKTIDEELADTALVVCYTSNFGVLAGLRGVPVIATHPCAAASFGCINLARAEDPVKPDNMRRWETSANLSGHQWSRAEMRDGTVWKELAGGKVIV